MTKEELQRIAYLYVLVDSYLEEIKKLQRWTYQLSPMRYDATKVQTSTIADPTAEAAVRVSDRLVGLVGRLHQAVTEFIDLRDRAEETIQSVDSPECQLVLRMRYLEGKNWKEIGEAMHYGRSQVHRVHREALEKMAHNGT